MRRSLQRRTVAAGGLLLVALHGWSAVCLAAPVPPVSPVRFWTLNDATRVVIEATGEFQFTSDRVGGPDRLFFDVKGARVKLDARGQRTIAVGDRLLKQIRIAETQPGVTRVVFDLDAPVEFTASQLTNPSRLIVELRPGLTTPTATVPPPRVAPILSSAAKVAAVPAKIESPEPVALPDPAPAPKLTAPPPLKRSKVRVESVPDPTKGQEHVANLKPPRPATLGSGAQSMTRVLGLKVGRIVLDAGHGGHDTGTIGPGGMLEKDLVLDVTKRLGALVETRMGAEVVYTRSDDMFIGLEARTRMANDYKADLFLSIHANSSPADSSSGVETYYLNFTTSKAAMEVAARENASSQSTVYELRDLLQKIALQDKVDESREFAARVQQGLYTASARAMKKTKNRGVKKAPFVVLIGAQMPSVLAEIGFISNPKDEALLKKGDIRQKIAEGLYKGLAQYAATLSQFQVASN